MDWAAGMKEAEVKRLGQHAFPYLNFLSNALDELNFKVVVCVLDVLRVSVGRLGAAVEPHLGQVVGALAKHLGNQKAVLRQLNMMTVAELAARLGPKPVLAALAPSLAHRNSRVREEVLNILTALLLKYPSNAVNLTAVASAVAPLLADPKRRVRLAAFELITVLAQALGPARLEPLLRPVRDVEAERSAPGLLAAVQARLARHQLPKVTSHHPPCFPAKLTLGAGVDGLRRPGGVQHPDGRGGGDAERRGGDGGLPLDPLRGRRPRLRPLPVQPLPPSSPLTHQRKENWAG